ncbi:Mucin-21 [Rhodotorula mucilaginosa]|uniref:Mucin-21 n=1 Tax=Rhodotorula mucilaginosa TaxID=5537 RepID=A0A9P7B7A3_RHOMI|nr:Mucin-21 [Rhodotorula mucilaginosa]
MHIPTSIAFVLSLVTLSHVAQSLPTLPRRDINISHKSLTNGTTTTHSISNADLPLELAKALAGSDVNINLTTDRRKRSPWVKRAAAGVNNSTINLTVIGTRSLQNSTLRRGWAARQRAPLVAVDDLKIKTALNTSSSAIASPLPPTTNATHPEAEAAATPTGTHHNIHIDASSSGEGGVGGIHNSTVNINLHQITTTTNNNNNNNNGTTARRVRRRKVALGDHSVLVDVSSSVAGASAASDAAGGIEDSTVHVNILPGRSLTKSTGHHSIVVDSSSLGDGAASSTTETGSHSAVVDTSSSSSTGPATAGVKNSTINLTVIAPSDSASSSQPADEAAPAAAAEDDVDSSIPALSRLSKRATAASEEWETNFVPLDHDLVDEPSSFTVVPRRRNNNHASRMRA